MKESKIFPTEEEAKTAREKAIKQHKQDIETAIIIVHEMEKRDRELMRDVERVILSK